MLAALLMFRAVLAEARSLQPPGEHLLLINRGRKSYFKRIGPTEFQLFLHGVAFPTCCRVLSTRWELPFQACREPSARLRFVAVLIYLQILDSWPSNRPFWRLGQLDADLLQIVDQQYIGARFVIECWRLKDKKWVLFGSTSTNRAYSTCLGIYKWMFLFTQSLRALRQAYTKESWYNGYVFLYFGLGLLVCGKPPRYEGFQIFGKTFHSE